MTSPAGPDGPVSTSDPADVGAPTAGPRRRRWLVALLVVVLVAGAGDWAYGRIMRTCHMSVASIASGGVGAPTSQQAVDDYLAKSAAGDGMPTDGWQVDADGLTYRSGDAMIVVIRIEPPGSGFVIVETRTC